MSFSPGLSHVSLRFLALDGEASPRPHFTGQKLRPRLTRAATRGLLHQPSSLLPAGGRSPSLQEQACRGLRSAGWRGQKRAHHSALGSWREQSLSALLGAGSLFGVNGHSWDPGKLVIGAGSSKSLLGSNSYLRPGCCFKSGEHFDFTVSKEFLLQKAEEQVGATTYPFPQSLSTEAGVWASGPEGARGRAWRHSSPRPHPFLPFFPHRGSETIPTAVQLRCCGRWRKARRYSW